MAMKKTIYALFIAIIGLLGATSCADLGFGVDVDSATGVNPYWYGNGYLGNNYWNTPVWNYGPIYNPAPSRPPYVSGPAVVPVPPRPQAPSQVTPSRPVVNVRPTVNGGAMNNNPSSIPQGRALE